MAGSRSESDSGHLEDGVDGIEDPGNPELDEMDDEGDADLFGDEREGEEATKTKRRRLDDEELDSGDDEGRQDRIEGGEMDGYGEQEEAISENRQRTLLDVDLSRHPVPDPSDCELYLFSFPKHVGIEPKPFRLETFQPPTTDHHSEHASSAFSASQTSNSTIRWRYSPSAPSEIQSNARVLRWSDGSLTLQIASNAREHYQLSAKPLAPPQINPPKPVPTAKSSGRVVNEANGYNARLDSHTYLVTTHETNAILRITNHITASLGVKTTSVEDDDALTHLREKLAAAKGNKSTPDGGLEIINVTEDPELAKKKAEVAEKEKIRAQRRRQQQEERERDRANRVLGRSGLRTGGYGAGGGLTVGALEDDDGVPGARPSRPSKPKRPRRRNSEYSDDEDYRFRGRTKEDEYDEDDGFLVGSDEEPEIIDDESEEEAEELGDEDAEGDEEEVEKPPKPGAKREAVIEEGATGARVKRRRVIEDEDEE
ncbi:MAG: hypothetical protein LQ342_001618 [Letrouitia transgressa]|nr:MAG: hypothetical protein LQ342_001618 [Letrouitia transgressa]